LEGACAVVATVGTTSCTSVDPVAAIAARCAADDVWLHVDAAYAGSAMVCPEFRWAFAGVERADSLVVNPHKWLFVPQGCSALWTRRPEAFRHTFSLVPEYLRTPETVPSLSEYGPELGRRFRALKLWLVLRQYGAEGLRARIREAVRLAATFEERVVASSDWELAAPREFSVVCFRRTAGDEVNEAILEQVNAAGDIFISHTKLDGRYVLRLAVGNERTTEADIARAWSVLEEIGEKVAREAEAA
ncbi:MAG TPA: pyridoxal-dependent decarboxylase, partial [Gaiellaceae bacterium]|nr:pyridoxal-dependent decarboxylase [Gaiellaceae bacterium]